jgi:hypothetical protein
MWYIACGAIQQVADKAPNGSRYCMSPPTTRISIGIPRRPECAWAVDSVTVR